MPNHVKKRLLNRVVQRLLGTVIGVSTQTPLVALTFDDGPHPTFTPRLLDLLDHHQAKATFFVVGEAAQQHPELIQRMAHAGHVIGNHTWDHPSFALIDSAERRQQVLAVARATMPYGQKFFRPPYGHQTLASRFDLWRLCYSVVTWNVASEDWLAISAEQIADRVADQLQPGSIVLFHDALYTSPSPAGFDRTATLGAVDRILQQFHRQFAFVTVPALLQAGRPLMRNWHKPADRHWLNALYKPSGPSRQYPIKGKLL
jgi:peptidoglycan-N-acetylglucosamine deacetylase